MHTQVDADLIFLRLLQIVQLDPVLSLSSESKELSAVMILLNFVSIMQAYFLCIFKKLKAKKTQPPKKLKAIFCQKTQYVGIF